MTRWSGTHSFIRNSDSVSRETVAPLMSGGAIVVFWMLFRRRRADIPIGIFFSTTLHHERPRDCGFT